MRQQREYHRATRFLEAHGADGIEHPGGTLLAHLYRTADLLDEWGAARQLTLAGFCHAAYGTDGFPTTLIALSHRGELVEAIGSDAEAIVYFYASCDRGTFLPQLGEQAMPLFRDRFTGAEFLPERELLRQFVELTFANELDVMLHSTQLAAMYGADSADLFRRCRGLASDAANAAVKPLPIGRPSPHAPERDVRT